MFVIVTVIHGDKVFKIDLNTKRKQSHLKQILVKEHGVPRNSRLIFKGKELEEKPLTDQGVSNLSEITVMEPQDTFQTTNIDKAKRQELGYMPSNLSDLQTHLLQNPEIMQQMLNSPAMQSLLNDSKFLEAIIKQNPATRAALEVNPAFMDILSDPEYNREAKEVCRNPALMRDILDGTDRAVKEIRNLANGVEIISGLYESLGLEIEQKDPVVNERNKKILGIFKPGSDGSLNGIENNNSDEQIDPETGLPLGADGLPIPQVRPTWHNAIDASAMASMMQDPNLQQLMAQYMETTERDHAYCFSNANFIASLFRSNSMNAVCSMESAIKKMEDANARLEKSKDSDLKGNTNSNGSKESDNNAITGGGTGAGSSSSYKPPWQTPGETFSKTFETFLEAQSSNPESKYKTQLTKMRNTGFTNTEKCIRALEECNGKVQDAIQLLLREGERR